MSSSKIGPIFRVISARSARAIVTTLAVTIALLVVIGMRKGFTLAVLGDAALGAAIMLPLIGSGTVVRSKSDGSLRFLAGLPVRGSDHAWAWIALCAILSVPAAFCASVVMAFSSLHLEGVRLLVSFLGFWGLASTFSLCVVAIQLSVAPGRAASVFVIAICTLIVALQLIDVFQEKLGFSLVSTVESQWLFPLLSTVFYLFVGAACMIAFRRVAFVSCTFVGDPIRE